MTRRRKKRNVIESDILFCFASQLIALIGERTDIPRNVVEVCKRYTKRYHRYLKTGTYKYKKESER